MYKFTMKLLGNKVLGGKLCWGEDSSLEADLMTVLTALRDERVAELEVTADFGNMPAGMYRFQDFEDAAMAEDAGLAKRLREEKKATRRQVTYTLEVTIFPDEQPDAEISMSMLLADAVRDGSYDVKEMVEEEVE